MIEALLFDLGRVVIDIDAARTHARWAELAGVPVAHIEQRHSASISGAEAFWQHERGEISDAEFFAHLRRALEDLAAAAEVLVGRHVAKGTRLIVIPVTAQVYLAALKAGYIQTFIEAGAVVESPGCGPCMGNHMGVPAVGEVVISSANRNFQGRMGSPKASVFMGSPATVAASAVAGVITDPRDL